MRTRYDTTFQVKSPVESHDFYDISPDVTERTAVFPGDTPFSRKVELAFEKGDHLALSSIAMSVHVGAHVDAPNHYHHDGCGIGERDLSRYFGACQVIEVKLARGERVLPAHIEGIEVRAPRVLFKTGSFPDPDRWNGDFNSLSPELIAELHAKGVRFFGIDTPSIDPADSKRLESHQEIFRTDSAILEGIVLDGVPPGLYTLVALPLKLKGVDASPVRAILLKGGL